MAAMGNIGKGLLLLLTRTDDLSALAARVVTFVAIFNAVGARDEALMLSGKALQKTPFPLPNGAATHTKTAPGAGCMAPRPA